MNNVLVDTCVFSYFFKNDTRGQLYLKHVEGKAAYLCFISVAELYRWAWVRSWGAERISGLKLALSAYTVLPHDEALSWEWARLMARKGQPIAPADCWVVAAAIRYNMPIITHNPADFTRHPELTVIAETV
jgi:tRNA(fMet)-specific endonuclease VapC